MSFWRLTIGMLLAVILASGLMLVVGFASDPEIFPVKKIIVVGEISGEQKIELQEILTEKTSHSSWLALFSKHIYDMISESGWADSIQVKKHWPDQIVITVVPKTPHVIWRPLEGEGEGDETEFLTKDGHVLPKTMFGSFSDIPVLECEKRQISGALTLLDVFFGVFSGNLLNLHALILDKRGNLTVRLSNGEIWRFGNRFKKETMGEQIGYYLAFRKKQKRLVSSVDFRYVNGFAIRFEES